MATSVQASAPVASSTQVPVRGQTGAPRRGRRGTRDNSSNRQGRTRGADAPSGGRENAGLENSGHGRHGQNQHGRGRGAGRGGRGRGNVQRGSNTTRTELGARAFAGRLTRDNDAGNAQPPVETGSLRANAPEFVPGQPQSAPVAAPSTPRPKPKQHPPRPARAVVKSTAHDIATRTHEDIANGLYECPICTGELGRRSKVWSCTQCWTVFHLSCIKKWSSNEGSIMARPRQLRGEENGEMYPRQWRCPGCNLPHDILPSTYSCWCEKEIDPRSLPGLPPHSCGQTCSKMRKGCPHPCDNICHAGPCPQCTAMGPTQMCFCGKRESTKRCVDTDYESGWSCGEVCGEMLPCLEHSCPRPCHEGLCGACEEKVDVRCYCGKSETQMLCSSKEEEEQSRRRVSPSGKEDEKEIDEWIGSFDCGAVCGRPFDCEVHFCEQHCHPQDVDVPHCPLSTDVVSHCACGKTRLEDIPEAAPRSSCQDPITNCKEACGKVLPCGHTCPRICHTGSCPPCYLTVSITCRCGRSSFNSMCHQGTEEPPQCLRVCKAGMNCGRHMCGERCCPGERKSIERQATKRKLKSLNVANQLNDDDIEAEHICTRICGRTLKCSQHQCPELCHKGSCGTCREAIFEEISCNCGRSVLYPPLPCGTKPPPCGFPCDRPKSCGHPQTSHNCHGDEEGCPKCPFLTEKRCLCGKKTLKNQPCWVTNATCGLVCGEELKCGSHTCKKQCHRTGQCEDTNGSCQQACGKIKKICSHPCAEPCHAPFPCPEKGPCPSMVTVACACGRLKQEKRCGAGKDSTKARQHTPLRCDEECARLERNRSLASALNISIDPSTTTASHPALAQTLTSENLPYSDETLDQYIQLSSSSTLATLQSYESALHDLAISQAQRHARFAPARSPLRAFVHSLAADWGFQSESFDPEPHRHVLVFKSAGWVPPAFGIVHPVGIGVGGVSVGECAKVRDRERMRHLETKRVAAEKAKLERLAAEQAAAASGSADVDGGGWAQVASKKKTAQAAGSPFAFGDVKSSGPVGTGMGRFGTLVLRSGVGKSSALSAGKAKGATVNAPSVGIEDVVDDWEEEVEKE